MSVRKNQFKFQIAAFFLVAILIWIDFYAVTSQKRPLLNKALC